jgi:GTP 3',8-cyclase
MNVEVSATQAAVTQRVKSKLEIGIIRPPTNLELIVSDHCNISCRQCNHASPVRRKWNATAEDAERDLKCLTGIYRAKYLRLIGGEPVLNPHLADIIGVATKADVAEKLILVSNGILLNRLSDDVFAMLDEVEVSYYPNVGLNDAAIDAIRLRGAQLGTGVRVAKYPEFRYSFSSRMLCDEQLVEKIWRGCRIANIWGCHAVYKGKIYRCPQSIYAPSVRQNACDSKDGLALSQDVGFQQTLLAFLNSSSPLDACQNCVGTNGKKFGHEIVSRKGWAGDLDQPPEEMIDYELLEASLAGMSEIDDCRVAIREGKWSRSRFATRLRRLKTRFAGW